MSRKCQDIKEKVFPAVGWAGEKAPQAVKKEIMLPAAPVEAPEHCPRTPAANGYRIWLVGSIFPMEPFPWG